MNAERRRAPPPIEHVRRSTQHIDHKHVVFRRACPQARRHARRVARLRGRDQEWSRQPRQMTLCAASSLCALPNHQPRRGGCAGDSPWPGGGVTRSRLSASMVAAATGRSSPEPPVGPSSLSCSEPSKERKRKRKPTFFTSCSCRCRCVGREHGVSMA